MDHSRPHVSADRSIPEQCSDPPETGEMISGNGKEVAGFGKPDLCRIRVELDKLPVEQRAVLMLVCVDGLTYEEAAAILGIPVGVLVARISRGRLSLAENLRRNDDAQISLSDASLQ
jgi:RNA polymerase sigma-70 factor (ECF subfamily)